MSADDQNMGRNKDFITQEVDRTLKYRIFIEPNTNSISSQFSDIHNIISKIFNFFESVLIPTSYESHIDLVESTSLDNLTHDHIAEGKDYSISENKGISVQNIRDLYFEEPNESTRVVRQFTLNGGVCIYLNDGFVRVRTGENPERYKKRHRGKIVGEADESVFTFDFRYKGLAKRQDDPYYVMTVYSRSDLWIQNTTIGQINRARLSRCFQQFIESLNVIQVECPPQYYKKELVRSVIDYDGPPADELIEAYQRQDEDR